MKRLLLLIVGLTFLIISGCSVFSEGEIMYEGNLRPIDEVEEIISDKLEIENPDLDLKVDIYEDLED